MGKKTVKEDDIRCMKLVDGEWVEFNKDIESLEVPFHYPWRVEAYKNGKWIVTKEYKTKDKMKDQPIGGISADYIGEDELIETKPTDIESMVSGMTPNNIHPEISTGLAVGQECIEDEKGKNDGI